MSARLAGFPLLLLWLLFWAALLGPGCDRPEAPRITTPYQAVFLADGRVFIGKIDPAGPTYLTLRDVHYIQTQLDPEKKQPRNLLVKRGREWHAPDYMQINLKQVAFIEPVAPDSHMARLIERLKKEPPPPEPPGKEEENPPPSGASQPRQEKPAPTPKPAEGNRPPAGR